MEKREYFKLISQIELEACLNLPIDELEIFDNSLNLKHIKFQSFQAKSEVNRERNRINLKETSSKIKSKVENLLNLPIEKLQEMLLTRSPNMQFRNLDKLDKNEIIKILGDYMLLDDLENENE
jgi:hypothetical protein